jgi:hypothetical protein
MSSFAKSHRASLPRSDFARASHVKPEKPRVAFARVISRRAGQSRAVGCLTIETGEEMDKTFTGPPPIYVFVTMTPNKRNGLSKTHTSRIGTCHNPEEIAGLIAEDRKAMGDTFGGLIDAPGTSGRSYRAFRAEWTEIKV